MHFLVLDCKIYLCKYSNILWISEILLVLYILNNGKQWQLKQSRRLYTQLIVIIVVAVFKISESILPLACSLFPYAAFSSSSGWFACLSGFGEKKQGFLIRIRLPKPVTIAYYRISKIQCIVIKHSYICIVH